MTKQKPRKFKGWRNVPEGVLVTAKSTFGERDRALIKINGEAHLKLIDDPDDFFEFMWAGYNPDTATTEKYREVIL